MNETRVPRRLNDDGSLWSHLGDVPPGADAIRKYRRTACPVEGDDDVDDFEDDPGSDTPTDDTPPPSDDVPDDKKPV